MLRFVTLFHIPYFLSTTTLLFFWLSVYNNLNRQRSIWLSVLNFLNFLKENAGRKEFLFTGTQQSTAGHVPEILPDAGGPSSQYTKAVAASETRQESCGVRSWKTEIRWEVVCCCKCNRDTITVTLDIMFNNSLYLCKMLKKKKEISWQGKGRRAPTTKK